MKNNPHPHLNPLPDGEETLLSPPLQGEGQGGDGGKRNLATKVADSSSYGDKNEKKSLQ